MQHARVAIRIDCNSASSPAVVFKMLSIKDKHIERMKEVLRRHEPPELPRPHTWKSRSEDDIWIRVVSQIAVIGNAKPAKKLMQPQYRDPIQWDLVAALSDEDAAMAIWTVLRGIGSRYAGKSLNKCGPTKSLVFNRNALRDFPGGPKGFLKTIATLRGDSIDKINFVTLRLQRIKNKGARDFLTSGFGLVRDHIALDTRVKKCLQHIGIQLPADAATNPSTYQQVEADLGSMLCKPLGISLADLDQLLFTFASEITAIKWNGAA